MKRPRIVVAQPLRRFEDQGPIRRDSTAGSLVNLGAPAEPKMLTSLEAEPIGRFCNQVCLPGQTAEPVIPALEPAGQQVGVVVAGGGQVE